MSGVFKGASLLIGLVVLAAIVALLVYDPKESSTVLSVKEANDASSKSNTDAANPNSSEAKPSFDWTPIPTNSLTNAECLDLEQQVQRQWSAKVDDANRIANQAYFLGEDKHKIANSLWQQTTWYDARKWYKRVKYYEAVKQHLASLRQFALPRDFSESFENFETRDKTAGDIKEIPDFSKKISGVWSFIDLKGIQQSIKDQASDETILAQIDSVLASIPDDLLSNLELSPIGPIITSAVKLERNEIALALMSRYPSLTVQENEYDNQFAKQLLDALYLQLYGNKQTSSIASLVAYLNQSSEPFVFFKLPFYMSRLRVEQSLQLLEKTNTPVQYQIINDIEPPSSELSLPYSTSDFETSSAQYKQCQSRELWLESRQKPVAEWQSYEESDFVSQIKQSYEYQYCMTAPDTSSLLNRMQKVKKVVNDLSKQISFDITEIQDLNLSELDIPELTKDERAVVILALTRGLMDTNSLSNEEITALLSDASLVPQPDSFEIKKQFLISEVADVWMNHMPLTPDENDYRILNDIAKTGNFQRYQAVKELLNIDEHPRLDPLYFFIQGFGRFHLNGGQVMHFTPADNQGFIEYFQAEGVQLAPHHMRALFNKKLTSEWNYEELVKQFPLMQVSDDDNYFGVICD